MNSTVYIANSNGYQVIIVFDHLWRMKCHYRAGGTGTAVALPLVQFCIVSMANTVPFVIHYTVTVPFVIHYIQLLYHLLYIIQLPYHLLYIIYSYGTTCYTLYTAIVPFHLVSACTVL